MQKNKLFKEQVPKGLEPPWKHSFCPELFFLMTAINGNPAWIICYFKILLLIFPACQDRYLRATRCCLAFASLKHTMDGIIVNVKKGREKSTDVNQFQFEDSWLKNTFQMDEDCLFNDVNNTQKPSEATNHFPLVGKVPQFTQQPRMTENVCLLSHLLSASFILSFSLCSLKSMWVKMVRREAWQDLWQRLCAELMAH